MSPRRDTNLGGSAVLSLLLHAGVLGALLITLPHSAPPPPPPPEDSFAVEFEGHSDHAQKAEHEGKVAAQTDTETETQLQDNAAKTPPAKAPTEVAPPPPPPPPPQPTQQVEEPKPQDVPPPPPPKPSVAPAKPPPPLPKPKPPPPKPAEKPVPKSARTQPNITKDPPPDTRALLNTLEKFTVDQKQDKPPTHRYNPPTSGRKNGGGAKSGDVTGELSDGQRKAIGDEVRRCYAEDTAARDYATYVATITVTFDATGVARDAVLSDPDLTHANADEAFRAFAERAVRAVLDPTCAQLPVPPDLLGKTGKLTFRFRP